jgi:hypothetical protein
MCVSTATEPGRVGYDNDDFVAASHNTIVLLDGAGTPAGSDSGCRHGVAWYSPHLGTRLLNLATEQLGMPLTHLLYMAIKAVGHPHRHQCDLSHPGSPSATVVIARENAEELDCLLLADSVLVLETREQTVAICDDREAARESIVGKEPLDTLTAAVLLSDGASRLVDRFDLSTWPELVHLARTAGPSAIIDQVRAAERSDPTGQRWPRGKSSNDATAAYAGCRDSVDS